MIGIIHLNLTRPYNEEGEYQGVGFELMTPWFGVFFEPFCWEMCLMSREHISGFKFGPFGMMLDRKGTFILTEAE